MHTPPPAVSFDKLEESIAKGLRATFIYGFLLGVFFTGIFGFICVAVLTHK
jgi:tetrahydromethanopterin S-methyltransferase subunit B